MLLGQFDELEAKRQAKLYLAKSITTLSYLINIDHSSINEDSINPFDQSNSFYKAFECLKAEVLAYRKIGDLNE